jgi:UDPglucose 6-dehydrogenase
MGFDKRIGHHFLQPGIGYGGSCFPKDVKALTYMAAEAGAHPQLLNAVTEINNSQRAQVMRKLQEMLGDLSGKEIAILGLAFKENTDDIRESPSLAVAQTLLEAGARVRAYDPVAMPGSAEQMPQISMCANAYEAVEGADAVVIGTPWNEFKQLDMERLRNALNQPVMIDGRNMYEPERMKRLGFNYRGVGRGYNGAA